MPPDYNDLPLPKSERDSVEQMNQDNNSNDIKKLIDNESGESSSQKSAASDNQSLENSILKTLNEN